MKREVNRFSLAPLPKTKGVRYFCAFVQVGMDVSEWFPVNVRLRQGSVMSP